MSSTFSMPFVRRAIVTVGLLLGCFQLVWAYPVQPIGALERHHARHGMVQAHFFPPPPPPVFVPRPFVVPPPPPMPHWGSPSWYRDRFHPHHGHPDHRPGHGWGHHRDRDEGRGPSHRPHHGGWR